VHDVRARAREQADLFFAQVHAVRERDVRPRHADRIEIFDVAPPGLPLDQLDLGAVLGGVRVNQDPALARETRDPLQKPARATDGEARREAVADATLSRAVPPFEERERFGDRAFGLFL
jgi:hypothetical protein